MKTTFSFIISLLLLITSGNVSGKQIESKNPALQSGSFSILSTPDLNDLTSKWVSEYCSLNPGVKINVIKTSFNNPELGAGENLCFISNKSTEAYNETNWKLVIGHDVIVPIMNAENPFVKEVLRRGVSPEQFTKLFQNPEMRNWGTLLANSKNAPLHIYLTDDESINIGLSQFLQGKQNLYAGITVGNRDQVISAIQQDPYAIGFCKAVNIKGEDGRSMVDKIMLLPIDKNGNGSIDYMENIYTDLNAFQRGVWIGKYPKALCSDIYAVSKIQPNSENEMAFLRWVIADGQQLINASGYSDLAGIESQSQLDKINLVMISEQTPGAAHSDLWLVLIAFAAVIISGIVLNAFIHFYRSRNTASSKAVSSLLKGFDENTVLVPDGLYYDKTHTWAFMEKDGMVAIGIDDFLQHVTGPITRIEMKNPGERIKKGDSLFSIIQSGKQLNLYAPVSGTIKKQNEALINNSSFLNSSPYYSGWVYMLEPSNWFGEIHLMDMSDKYRRWLGAEFSRLKDFMAAILKIDGVEYAHVVLQDGGSLKDGVLSDLGPGVWEDFQTNFLDTFK
jgi:glycine cleavage system H lipoate-binding protein/ABC-type phosphate transport system substrate-binding protein